MTTDGLSYWQAETEGILLLEMTIGDLLDCRAEYKDCLRSPEHAAVKTDLLARAKKT